jgi:hypothetical protein
VLWLELRRTSTKLKSKRVSCGHDYVPCATSRVFPDIGSDFSGCRRFDDRPSDIGLDFRQEERAIPCYRRREK